MTINYQFGDVDAHGGALKAQAAALEAERQAILNNLNGAADMWGGQGSAGFQQFVTELNRNFTIIFQELHEHGGKVQTASHNTAHTDGSVGGSWAV